MKTEKDLILLLSFYNVSTYILLKLGIVFQELKRLDFPH